jgi:hypothetical protein
MTTSIFKKSIVEVDSTGKAYFKNLLGRKIELEPSRQCNPKNLAVGDIVTIRRMVSLESGNPVFYILEHEPKGVA